VSKAARAASLSSSRMAERTIVAALVLGDTYRGTVTRKRPSVHI
jgi:hypothetical protein